MDVVKEKDKFDKLAKVIAEHKGQDGPLMPVMQAAQEIFGYLPLEVQNEIAEGLDVPLTEVYGVATFYSQFSLEPVGEHLIGVCLGTACYVKGSKDILEKVSEALATKVGQTSADGLFTIKDTRCLGACGLAPVMMIGDEVYGRLVPDDVPGILKKYQK